jgi:hypothetical protein
MNPFGLKTLPPPGGRTGADPVRRAAQVAAAP